MESKKLFLMDICFLSARNQIHIRPTSIHGVLWLQTHFDQNSWEALASQQVLLTKDNAKMLASDAIEAGLIINSVPAISYSSKF